MLPIRSWRDGFLAVVVLTLWLGISINIATFSIVNAVLVVSGSCIHAGSSQTPCVLPLHLILASLFGRLEREQRDVIEFLRE